MKKTLLSVFLLIFIAITGFTQVPNAMNYQAVVRNSSGEIVANQNVSFRISILQGSESGSSVYSETHVSATNNFGLANLKIGLGSVENGVFAPGGWGSALHFLKIEFDPAGGSNYIHMGTTQLLSVPYAFHAQTVEEDNVDDADNDPFNEIQTLSIEGNQIKLSNGGMVELPTVVGGDNWGSQSVATDASINGDGTKANPLSAIGDKWGNQSVVTDATIKGNGTLASPLSAIGDNWGKQTVVTDTTLKGNGSVASPLTVTGDLTDDQTLSITGNNLTISGGNTVTLPQANNFWNKNYADELYYNLNVGIGTNNPSFNLDVCDETSASIARIYSNANNAGLKIDRRTTSDLAYTHYSTSNESGFYTGLIANNNYRITKDVATLKGLEVTSDGNVNLSDNLLLGVDKRIGVGIDNPATDIDINSPNASLNIKANSTAFLNGNAYCLIDKAATSNNAEVVYRIDGSSKFHTGLLGTNNYRISTNTSTLVGLEVEEDGDVVVSDELHTSSTGTYNMLPIAYGTINSSGTTSGCTPGVIATKVSTGQYKVSIPDLGSTYSAIVSPSQGIAFLTCVVIVKSTNYFTVAVWDTKNDAYYDGAFSFVVYRP